MARDMSEPDIVSTALARNRLGVPSVVFFGVAGAAPLTVVIGAITTIYAVVGNTAVPVVYLVVAGILSIFTVGFVAMSRHIVNSGAFYSYISHGLGRIPGVGAAFVALPAYALMQIGLFGLFGVVASGVLDGLGFQVGWFTCAIVAWVLVAVLGLLWVDLSGKVLAVLLIAEIVIVLVYDIVMVANPAGGSVSFATLSPAQVFTPEVAAMMVLAIGGFVGFEATVVLSEEAKDPRRTIARATHWAVILAGLLCGLSAWAMSVGAGPGNIVAAARAEETDLVFALVGPHLPEALINLGYVLFMTSIFAALLAFHAAVARYQFALGREGVLPHTWGYTHPRTGAPIVGSLSQSLLALGVLIVYRITGADPLVYLFAWLTVVGGLGVLILMWSASAAVIAFFLRHRHQENVWRGQVSPIVAFLLLSVILFATVYGLGDLLQVEAGSIFHWLFPTGYAVFAVVGFIWAVVMRAARPEVYAAIGRGADSGFIADAPRLKGSHTEPISARAMLAAGALPHEAPPEPPWDAPTEVSPPWSVPSQPSAPWDDEPSPTRQGPGEPPTWTPSPEQPPPWRTPPGPSASWHTPPGQGPWETPPEQPWETPPEPSRWK
ncbi:amino acid/polyamine/organocation transporter (APC superfamily) [Couchioplanes caeruleus]|uniref:Amino acid permease n=3 Tax=Couchioplanes caeruleus TaxID=56438 RepID=A0A1K0GU62_9ACTN|nr:APC family permease [Couchioplanes caeruleus]OJF16022.1 amino acid permease [Couchioplanes caeruleus subsp. caeruleus]ROP27879.1 amino acid/polyamine/organocation transporter (APC superfamily) [Couchioplanes caeruleus]